jgi:hypothetical protein
MDTTPDTVNFMIAGYAVVFVSMLVYIMSLFVRNRNLKQDEILLEELQHKDS